MERKAGVTAAAAVIVETGVTAAAASESCRLRAKDRGRGKAKLHRAMETWRRSWSKAAEPTRRLQKLMQAEKRR